MDEIIFSKHALKKTKTKKQQYLNILHLGRHGCACVLLYIIYYTNKHIFKMPEPMSKIQWYPKGGKKAMVIHGNW